MTDPAPADLQRRYRPRLEAEAAALRAQSGETSDTRRPVELDQQSVGRSRMDAMQQQAMAAALEARRGARRRAISAALARMDDGAFGFCEDCGDFIGFGRLDLDATLVRCVDCAG
jgi:DnaK suppressor protein